MTDKQRDLHEAQALAELQAMLQEYYTNEVRDSENVSVVDRVLAKAQAAAREEEERFASYRYDVSGRRI